jgi:serine protease inhibitor
MRLSLRYLLAAATIATRAATLPAQADSTGTIAGTVRDSAGHPLSHVLVVQQGTSRRATTDSLGHYTIPDVPIGIARIRALRLGFEPRNRDGIAVRSGDTSRVDLTLNVGILSVGPPVRQLTPDEVRDRVDSGAKGLFAATDTLHGTATYRAFSLALFNQLARQNPQGNIFISPASAAFALAMTASGAAGRTWSAMAATLGVDPATPDALGPANAAELASLGEQSGVQLAIANSIWASAGRPFLPRFLDGARRDYHAEVTSMVLHGPAAQARIDDWVARATNGKITSIVPDTMADSTAMVLVNAVYFNGKWIDQFDSTRTAEKPFRLGDGRMVSRRRMTQTRNVLYLADSGFRAVRLPYRGGRLAMYVFLPDSGTTLAQLYARMDERHWNHWMHDFHLAKTDVELPKFRLEYGTSLDAPLQALGMKIAYDPTRADFSRMLPRSFLADTNAFIQKVLQKTFVDVGEQGTEAAAATAVFVGVVPTAVERVNQFIVDRPFFVAIRDDKTGLILFMGQITDPTPGD